MPKAIPITEAQQHTFLEALEAGNRVQDAAQMAGRKDMGPWYRLRKRDDVFADAWAAAYDHGLLIKREVAEHELARRGIDGWDEETYEGERLVKRVSKKSDRALIMFLAANWPEKYSRRSHLFSSGEDPVEVNVNHSSALDELAETLRVLVGVGAVPGRAELVEAEVVEIHSASAAAETVSVPASPA